MSTITVCPTRCSRRGIIERQKMKKEANPSAVHSKWMHEAMWSGLQKICTIKFDVPYRNMRAGSTFIFKELRLSFDWINYLGLTGLLIGWSQPTLLLLQVLIRGHFGHFGELRETSSDIFQPILISLNTDENPILAIFFFWNASTISEIHLRRCIQLSWRTQLSLLRCRLVHDLNQIYARICSVHLQNLPPFLRFKLRDTIHSRLPAIHHHKYILTFPVLICFLVLGFTRAQSGPLVVFFFLFEFDIVYYVYVRLRKCDV